MIKNILIGITGSIAAYKACVLIRELKKKKYNVKAVMSKNASEFITPLTIETLTENKVHLDSFKKEKDFEIEHINLAKWTDLFVIAPATANIIGKISSGIADNLISTTAISIGKTPILICPAMNTNMYQHPSIQKNIDYLKSIGISFVPPKKSKLACGDEGIGALSEIEDIVNAIIKKDNK
ncbi:MAG: phosphopantothenoylcysteine decarboxylase [Deltaproteobacteria bacterium]|jgi:phosphopantothenoylcysteine decarboxylase/phosphopantothenoylcysteine decarboxylase/phosphopantothenate--cysteine ligase|nr:phosphopantothenoylcysteine decarboxylase [Deltaproteobacteria bacterium]